MKIRIVKIVFSALLVSFTGLSVNSFTLREEKMTDTPNAGYKIKTIVIDAGHGGKDFGAKTSWATEKHVALAVALDLGKRIKQAYPDINVIYTRKTDIFVPLDERANIANKNKADLFISIHCNSNKNTVPFGTETYVMGLHRSQENLEVAQMENSVILLEENYAERYEGFDPASPESYILFSLYQNKYLDKSLSLASKIETEFNQRDKRQSRGVKQAGFLVLRKTAMPSVLVEIGFISNQKEGNMLNTKAGQEQIASSLFRAFTNYKKELEKN